MFARWGRFVYRRRWITLAGSLVLLAASAFVAMRGGTLAGNGSFGAQLPAGTASKLVSDEIHAQAATTGSGMTLLFSSPDLVATDASFQGALEQAVER